MTSHRLFAGNGVYPWFRSTLERYRHFERRAAGIAQRVLDEGCDSATFCEMGKRECAILGGHLPWTWNRSQGSAAGEGLNSTWTNPKVFDQPDAGPGYNLPSGGQMQRTLMLSRVTEKKDPKAFLTLGAFHESLGNDAGMAYIVAMIARCGEKRLLLAGDFKRTGDTDDMAVMRKAGYVFHERVRSTPMVAITQHNVGVSGVEHNTDDRLFDHEYLVVDYSIPNPS